VLKARGIRFDEKRSVANGHFQERGGYEEALRLLEEEPDFRGAIVCANDAMALGVMRALGEAGVKCPGAVAVTGFDGIAMGEFSNPPLTTVKFELYEMGKSAVRILRNVISRKQKGFVKEKFPFRLIERKSC